MKCNEAQKKLSPYLDRQLDQEQMKRIEDHLKECPLCLKEFELFRGTDASLKGIPSEDLSKEFHDKLIRELEAFSRPVDRAVNEKGLIRSAFRLMDRFSGLFFRRKGPWTMDAFEDFPPWSLGHAYLKMINQN